MWKYMYVQFFKAPDSIFHKSMTYDGELQLPLKYKQCSVNYQETKEEEKSLLKKQTRNDI